MKEARSPVDPAEWVDSHGDYLYSFALSRVREESRAEDLVQETLLAAMQSIRSYEEKSSQRTWLTGILKHKIIDHFRKSNREIGLTKEEEDMSSYDYLFRDEGEWKGHWTSAERPAVWEGNPEKVMENEQFRGVLSHCMGKLPERIACVFTMREMEGLDAEEICTMLSVSNSNFWVMMHRARLHLRKCIDVNWFRKVHK